MIDAVRYAHLAETWGMTPAEVKERVTDYDLWAQQLYAKYQEHLPKKKR